MNLIPRLAAVACLATALLGPAPTRAQTVDIVDTAAAAGSFNTLLAAVEAAGLTETLRGPEHFTVFAPTDEAFAALPPGTLEALLEPANRDQLTTILSFHVLPYEAYSSDLLGKAGRLETAAGLPLGFDATGTPVNVGGASVIGADVEASNGVIHVVDRVILPPQ